MTTSGECQPLKGRSLRPQGWPWIS